MLWNVNGLRAIAKKEVKAGVAFDQFIKSYDIVVLNETKISATQLRDTNLVPSAFIGYHSHSITKKGYSGVSILTKLLPLRRLDPTFSDTEGRMVILEYESFILIGVYVPNAGAQTRSTGLPARHRHRNTKWDIAFREMCVKMERKKPIVVLGDMNVAFTEQDVHAPSRLTRHAGFTIEERNNFGLLLEATTLIDVWRRKYPSKVAYSFFDYRSKARERNAGWRIDYALVSKSLYRSIGVCSLLANVYGSDHLPLMLDLSAK